MMDHPPLCFRTIPRLNRFEDLFMLQLPIQQLFIVSDIDNLSHRAINLQKAVCHITKIGVVRTFAQDTVKTFIDIGKLFGVSSFLNNSTGLFQQFAHHTFLIFGRIDSGKIGGNTVNSTPDIGDLF